MVIIQLGEAVFAAVLPNVPWANRLLTLLLLLGFPVVMVLGWVFDIGPSGIHRTTALLDDTAPAQPQRSWARAERQPRNIELVEEAPSAERVRSASLAFVRHELRTPVNAIIGYSEMLLEDAQDEADSVATGDLQRIQQCGREILALVESILDAERIEKDSERDLASYGEQIRADLRDPLGAVTGYSELLIEVSEEQGKTARVKDLKRILSASQKLLELSNDIVALATRAPGAAPSGMAKGATLAEGVLSKIREVQHHAERSGSLLVVDDSAINRDLIASQLARKGYVVSTAENGRIALEILNEQSFDVVLLDVLMPELDGVEVLRRMKGDAALCDVPVIMISALDEVDSIVRCLEIGAADFVSKPFHPTLLDARIQAAIAVNSRQIGAVALDADLARLVAGTFPNYITRRISAGETRVLDSVDSAAALFVDLDQAVAAANPRERAARMEALLQSAHEVAAQHGATVLLSGIGLLMASGFPQPVADAPKCIAEAALDFARKSEALGLKCRAAMHVGPLNAAVVGSGALSYSVWGEAVDLSRRMAMTAERGQIMVSAAAHNALKETIPMSSLGVIDVAGRGQMKAYLLGAQPVAAR